MHKAFRTPLLPALQGAARSRIYSTSTATTSAPGQTGSNTEHEQERTAGWHKLRGNLSTPVDREASMRMELNKIKNRLDSRTGLKDIQNLVQVHAMMDVYRRYRGEVEIVNASEPIHAILTTLRLRSRVLKPVISTVRRQIMDSQNVILTKYLNEIVDDLVSGRSYASRFALNYMLTAFSTMEDYAQASAVWKRLNEFAKSNTEDLSEKLQDPRVVSAALRWSDPSVMTLEDLERTHRETTERHGRYILADEALAMGYLRFMEWNRAVEMYASMCEYFDVNKWHRSLVRLHNQILTQCTDINIAGVFFNTATSEDSFVGLHPSASMLFIRHLYNETGDIDRVLNAYDTAMQRLATQPNPFETSECITITAESMRIIASHFATQGPVPEVQTAIARLIEVNPDQLVLNTVLSTVSKAWPGSEYIISLQQKWFSDPSKLGFDSIRVLLNSAQSLSSEQIPVSQVAAWWERSLSLKSPQVFDWMSLAKACDNADRVEYLVEQVRTLEPEFRSLRLAKAPIAEQAIAAFLNEADKSGIANGPRYSDSMVESELTARQSS